MKNNRHVKGGKKLNEYFKIMSVTNLRGWRKAGKYTLRNNKWSCGCFDSVNTKEISFEEMVRIVKRRP